MFLALAFMFISGLSTGIFLTGISVSLGLYFKEYPSVLEWKSRGLGRELSGEILGGKLSNSGVNLRRPLGNNVGVFWEEEQTHGVNLLQPLGNDDDDDDDESV